MSIRIGAGLAGFPFSDQAEFWRWVDFCEDSRIDSLWFSERLVSPQPFLEPVSTLAALAGRTRRLKFGMNAVVLPLRDPLVLAKECATIDFLSEGRLLPVFGVGNDNAPEFAATGVSPSNRGPRSNEFLELLSRLWSEERVTYRGKHYSYTDVTISPRPVQTPLPLWIGGSSAAAIERTARLGSGWLGGSGQTPESAGATVRAIRSRLSALRREGAIEDDHYGAGIAFRFGSWDDAVVERNAALLRSRLRDGEEITSVMAVGDAATVVALVRRFVEAGVSKFVLRPVASSGADFIEQTRLLEREVIPEVHAPAFAAVSPGSPA
jgi:probable F420-dependent oxidoreductase